jgi:hypothetical protein
MREVTVAKGQLRCGECHAVFNASSSLSTTMPKPYSEQQVEYLAANADLSHANAAQTQRDIDIPATSTDSSNTLNQDQPRLIKGIERNSNSSRKWLISMAFTLLILLALQVAYNYRHLIYNTDNYQPDKIKMLNHNVFTHPIESGVLLISASIENTAETDQPYPLLEVRLTDSKSNIVALRRFEPTEYLDNYQPGMLIKKKQTSNLKLKIKDPGNQATRFQFDFL